MGHSSPRTGKLSTRGIFLMAKAPSLRKDRNKGIRRTRKLSTGNALWSWRNGKGRFVRARRETAGAKPYTMKVVRTVFNGGHEETYGNATRLVPTQLIDVLVEVPLHRPIAAGRIGIQATAGLHSKIGRFLHCLHGEIFGRLDDDSPLPTDPGDDRGPVLVVMASTGLAFLAAATRSAPQGLCATVFGLAFLSGGVIEVIRFHCALQPAIGFVGDGRIAQPPAPAI
jgi:hypothetical protein